MLERACFCRPLLHCSFLYILVILSLCIPDVWVLQVHVGAWSKKREDVDRRNRSWKARWEVYLRRNAAPYEHRTELRLGLVRVVRMPPANGSQGCALTLRFEARSPATFSDLTERLIHGPRHAAGRRRRRWPVSGASRSSCGRATLPRREDRGAEERAMMRKMVNTVAARDRLQLGMGPLEPLRTTISRLNYGSQQRRPSRSLADRFC